MLAPRAPAPAPAFRSSPSITAIGRRDALFPRPRVWYTLGGGREAHEEGRAPESLPADAARRGAILAARNAVLEMRRRGDIGDDAYFLLEEEFDWAELSATPRSES